MFDAFFGTKDSCLTRRTTYLALCWSSCDSDAIELDSERRRLSERPSSDPDFSATDTDDDADDAAAAAFLHESV